MDKLDILRIFEYVVIPEKYSVIFQKQKHMNKIKNPKEVLMNNTSLKLKLNTKGVISALIRTVIDYHKGTLSSGTIPEWIKTVGIKGAKEKQLFTLISNALMDAVHEQIKIRIDQVEIDENKNLVSNDKILQFDIFSQLDGKEYSFNCDHFSNPQSLHLIEDFKTLYKNWLLNSFSISNEHANLIIADFPDYFAVAFHKCLNNRNKYVDLLDWCKDPITEQGAKSAARIEYKNKLKSYYQQPALGEQQVALSDVYVEPSFLVFDKILSVEKQLKIKEKHVANLNNHFLNINFDGSIHDYITQHFLEENKSKEIDQETEKSRLLILMGQPGHGKSSFCYRSIHDVLRQPNFNCNVFFIRLQDIGREFINTPLSEINDWLPQEINFEEYLKSTFNNQKNILFLDGLDEMFMTQSLSDSDVILMINNLKKLLDKYSNLYIIITSRFNYVETSKLYNSDCLLFSLGTLNVSQQEKLVENFKKRTPNQTCNLEKDTLEKCNTDDSLYYIKELIELPILLQMILISGIDVEDTQSKATVYNRLFETVLQRKWDKDKRLKKYRDENNFKPYHLRDYISLLAYKIFQNNRGYLNKSDIEALEETRDFKRRYLRIEGDTENLKPILKDILTSFYFKESRKSDEDKKQKDKSNEYAIEFLHKSLYEYLACEYIWTEIKDFFLEKDSKYENEYKRHDIFTALIKIQKIFATIRLSDELMGYLGEIINNDAEVHDRLVQQITEYLPRLLKHGFIYEFKRGESTIPPFYTSDQQVINCFHCFWVIFGQLGNQKISIENYFDSSWVDFKQSFLKNGSKKNINIAYQQYINKLTVILTEHKSDEQLVKQIKKYLKEEGEHFNKWLNEDDYYTSEFNDIFERWLRRYLFFINARKTHANKINSLGKEKNRLSHLLRLTGATHSSMKLHFKFLDFTYANFISLYAIDIDFSGADLLNADLRNADFTGANLQGANLSQANLNYIDLRRANLSYANLNHMDIGDAYLREANLESTDARGIKAENANLSHTNLRDANFHGANLFSANLSGANIFNTNFHSANLSMVNLSGAKVISVDWIEKLNLQNVIGIEYIQKKYSVREEMIKFHDNEGNEYEAYVIKERENDEP